MRRVEVRISAPELRVLRSTLTDVEGRYEFHDVPAGRYSVNASKTAFAGWSYGQTQPGSPGKPLVLADNTHHAYLRAVDETSARLEAIERELRDLLTLEPLWSRVQRLRCFRGIDDLTALTIAAEFGDPRRFPTAPSTMAFVGLVPSEYSSGPKRARGAITKTGNAHLRRVLVEAAWHYRHHPFVGRKLRQRQLGAPLQAIDHA